MKTSELSGNLLNQLIGFICIEKGIFTRYRDIYTLPYLYHGHNNMLFISDSNTNIVVRPKPIPPKFYRGTPVPFDPVNNATQGLPIIEQALIAIEPYGGGAIARTGGYVIDGRTYLEAGLRAVVAKHYGDDVPDEVPL